MSLIIAKKEMQKNPYKTSINIIVVTLFFAIVISMLNIAPQLSNQLKNVSSYNVKTTILTDIANIEESSFKNYYYSTGVMNVNYNENDIDVSGIFTSDFRFTFNGPGKAYFTKMAANKLGVTTGDSVPLVFTINDEIHSLNIDVVVLSLITTYEECYFTKEDYQLFNLEEAYVTINIDDYQDLEDSYNLLIAENAYESSSIESFFAYYKMIKATEMFLYVIAIVCLIIACFILFNLMDIFVSKRERFIGILKNEGANSGFIFKSYAIMIEIIAAIALVLATIVSFLLNIYIASQSLSLLDMQINIKYIWYIPILVFAGFNLLFIFFFVILKTRIQNTDTALVIRRE